jgi:hypothetical protein
MFATEIRLQSSNMLTTYFVEKCLYRLKIPVFFGHKYVNIQTPNGSTKLCKLYRSVEHNLFLFLE